MAAAASLRMFGERWESLRPNSETPSEARAGRVSSLEQEVRVERSSTCTSSSSSSSSSSTSSLSFSISLGTRVRRASAPAGRHAKNLICLIVWRLVFLLFIDHLPDVSHSFGLLLLMETVLQNYQNETQTVTHWNHHLTDHMLSERTHWLHQCTDYKLFWFSKSTCSKKHWINQSRILFYEILWATVTELNQNFFSRIEKFKLLQSLLLSPLRLRPITTGSTTITTKVNYVCATVHEASS